jgi:hypothetical protein
MRALRCRAHQSPPPPPQGRGGARALRRQAHPSSPPGPGPLPPRRRTVRALLPPRRRSAAPADRARSTSSATSVTPAPALRAVRTPVALSVAFVGGPGQARPVQRPRESEDGGTLGSTARVTRRGARRACGACRPPPTTTLSLSAANLKRASQSGRDSRQRRTASPALGPQVKASRSRSPSIITASINAAGGRVRLVMPKADRA